MERVVFLGVEPSATTLSEWQHQPDEPNTEEEGRVERHAVAHSAFEAAPLTVRGHLPLQALAGTPQSARVRFSPPRLGLR